MKVSTRAVQGKNEERSLVTWQSSLLHSFWRLLFHFFLLLVYIHRDSSAQIARTVDGDGSLPLLFSRVYVHGVKSGCFSFLSHLIQFVETVLSFVEVLFFLFFPSLLLLFFLNSALPRLGVYPRSRRRREKTGLERIIEKEGRERKEVQTSTDSFSRKARNIRQDQDSALVMKEGFIDESCSDESAKLGGRRRRSNNRSRVVEPTK